jgi:hypothetical protein
VVRGARRSNRRGRDWSYDPRPSAPIVLVITGEVVVVNSKGNVAKQDGSSTGHVARKGGISTGTSAGHIAISPIGSAIARSLQPAPALMAIVIPARIFDRVCLTSKEYLTDALVAIVIPAGARDPRQVLSLLPC